MRPIASGGYRQTPTGRAVRGLEPPVVLPRVVTLVHSRCLEYRTSVLVTTGGRNSGSPERPRLVTPAVCPLVGQPRGTYTDFCEVSSTPTVVHLTSWTSRESNPTPGVAACGPNARRNQVEAPVLRRGLEPRIHTVTSLYISVHSNPSQLWGEPGSKLICASSGVPCSTSLNLPELPHPAKLSSGRGDS